MRTRIAIAGVVVLLIVAVLLGVSVIRRGFSARGTPSGLETFLARNLRRMAIPSEAKETANPYPFTPEKLPAAQDHCP